MRFYRIQNLIICLAMLSLLPSILEAATPVFTGAEMSDMLEQFTTDRRAFSRYFGRKNFKTSGRLGNIFGLTLLNVYSANIVAPQGEINCTPDPGPAMEHMEYLYDIYTPGQFVMVEGVIGGFAFGALMLTPCHVWTLPPLSEDLIKSATQGNAEAQYQLGEIYSFGLGLQVDLKAGKGWYQKAAEQGYTPAVDAIKLHVDRENISNYKADKDRLAILAKQEQERIATYAAASLDQLYQKVQNGDAEAQMCIGRRYLEGNGVTKDEKIGAEYLTKAVAQGHKRALLALHNAATPGVLSGGSADAAFALGQIYAVGQGVPASDVEALAWFRLAADGDYPGAVNMVKRYDDKVLDKLRKDVEHGDIEATLTLAKRYLEPENSTGFGVAQAIPLLIRAAGLGNVEALQLLEEQAAPGWFTDGNADAAFALGEIFYKGIGVVTDSTTATYWYGIAADKGVVEAKPKLEAIAKKANSANQTTAK